METLGVYIHIPFCRQKCLYCDFYSLSDCKEALMDGYLDALILQIREFFASSGRDIVDTVYIGGGTPSVFGRKRLIRLVKELNKCASISRQAEITVEVNPESVTLDLMSALRHVGVNRISMGVQSADDEQLKALGRLHTFAQAANAVQVIRKNCTENISLDLMYGLPGQTLDSWQASLSSAAGLRPLHISFYGLKIEEGTPFSKLLPGDLPDDDRQAEMYLLAVEFLAQSGYKQYEISNAAMPGWHSRHNSKYWDLSQYIGFGCGASSFYGGKRFSAVKDIEKYVKAVKSMGSIIAESEEEAFFDRAGEYIMLRLRTNAGLDSYETATRFGVDFSPFQRRLEKYVPTGHAACSGGVWRLTPSGMLISNTVIVDVLDGCSVF